MAQPTASRSHSTSNPDDEAYERDRQRFYAQQDPQQGPPQHAGAQPAWLPPDEQHRLPPSSLNEVFARCANEAVALTKCVEHEGPLWYVRCSEPFIAMQKCYTHQRSSRTRSLSEQWSSFWRETRQNVGVRVEMWQWWLEDQLSGRRS